MGGKLLNGHRMPRTEFMLTVAHLVKQTGLTAPTPVKKEDYGDVDLLHVGPLSLEQINDMLDTPERVKRNGPVTSVLWGDIQVDLIQVSNLEFAKNWYSYGLHAANMGCVYSWYGFKLKWDGLYRDGELVTGDWWDAMSLMGFLHPRTAFLNFGATKEELHQIILDNEYACKAAFLKKKLPIKQEVLNSFLPTLIGPRYEMGRKLMRKK